MKERAFVFSEDLIDKVGSLLGNDEVIGTGKKYVTRLGLAQKIVNLTYKYFYVFSDYIFDEKSLPPFSNCHCSLDNIILDKASIKNCVWSKLTTQEYIQCQDIISGILKNRKLDAELSSLGNLAFDFINW